MAEVNYIDSMNC